MKDYFGNIVKKGDTVALIAPNYRHFSTGKVIKVTPKRVLVRFSESGCSLHTDLLQSEEQIIKRMRKVQ